MNSIAAVILAAGAAVRFGSTKQLADIDGKIMLQRVLDNCQFLIDVDLYLVLGANKEDILPRLQLTQSQIILNSKWQEGMGSSIRTATTQLQNNYDGILFVAGDQPFVQGDQLARLVGKWHASPETICAAQYQGTVGIPAIFPRHLYSKLLLLEGDRGAKNLLRENSDNMQLVEIPEAAIDIDQPEDINEGFGLSR